MHLINACRGPDTHAVAKACFVAFDCVGTWLAETYIFVQLGAKISYAHQATAAPR